MNKFKCMCLISICSVFAACDKNENFCEPMEWSYNILTPENIKYEESGNTDLTPKYHFSANNNGGDIVMTCKNYDSLNPIIGNSYTYDCKWATVKVEANQLKIHFPYNASGNPDASEAITISANNGNEKVKTIIYLSRTYNEDPGSKPETLPDKYKFKLKLAGFTPFMSDDFTLPAPLDNLTFRVTDINDNYSISFNLPEYTQHYDSIVWSAEGYPNTVRIYDNNSNATEGNNKHFVRQWTSHFYKAGTIKNYLKGYRNGKIEYTAELNTNLYERDFLCYDWINGSFSIANPVNLTAFCLLDTRYEYIVTDTKEANGVRYSEIIPNNSNNYSESEFLNIAQEAIKTLMKNNIGNGIKADGKESLFKNFPANAIGELFWENNTTRMLLIHQLPSELVREHYYLLVESK